MDLNNVRYVYFLGIGGIGMSAIARYFYASGKKVSGYDKVETPLTSELIKDGIPVVFKDTVDQIPGEILEAGKEEVLLVYTPAIPADHPQLCYFQKEGWELYKRARVLGEITKDNYTIAVAGTHGKTTTSTLVTHLLIHAGIDCTAFLGGISVNYSGNYIQAANVKTSPIVVEADEFDRSFLHLRPDAAVITSMDADHLDIYGRHDALEASFREFARLLEENGFFVARSGLDVQARGTSLYYGIDTPTDYRAENVRVTNGFYWFDLVTPAGTIFDLKLGLPGRHNVENAVAASAVALHMGVDNERLRSGLASFKGVRRRFEYIIQTEKRVFIDDYAHHPAELKACIESVKELYPGKKITGIFQPHLFSRTRDFMDGFVDSLSLLDTCILLDIYPARELPIEGVSSKGIFDRLHSSRKFLVSKMELPALIRDLEPTLLLTLGAGDIDQLVKPLKEVLK